MSDEHTSPAEEQRLRADCYRFLSSVLLRPPGAAELAAIAAMPIDADGADEAPLACAWRALPGSAAATEPAALDEEYFALFVGLGRGQLVPFGSWYITGYLNERPLAELRAALARLGLAPDGADRLSEDHVAKLFAVMAALIDRPQRYALADQQQFYGDHLAPWIERFFDDLAAAKSAVFYRPVAALGRAFVAVERAWLSLPA